MTEEEWRKKFDKEADNDVDAISFENGMNWCRKNPAPEVLKLVEALKYYADERENERKVNVCEFNENLNRMYVCGDGSRAREALAEFEKATGINEM